MKRAIKFGANRYIENWSAVLAWLDFVARSRDADPMASARSIGLGRRSLELIVFCRIPDASENFKTQVGGQVINRVETPVRR